MGKHKKKSKKEKKSKKSKRERSPSTSSSTSDEWVEKSPVSKVSDAPREERQERDEWMSMSSSFQSVSTVDKRTDRENKKRLEKEQNQYNPKENVRELNPYWKDGGTGLPSFKKPSEDNFQYKKKSSSSNWRKKTDEEVKDINRKQTFSRNEEKPVDDKISKKGLNVLAAKIVKAELMGNTELVDELKRQLEDARKELDNSSSTATEEVLLTTIDSHGVSRPFKAKSQYGESSGTSRKKKRIETHVNKERVRYFPDDDKYSLKQMFENEKYSSIDEQNKEFVNIISKTKTDFDDIFTDEIRKKDSDTKSNKKEVDRAINAHLKVSKMLDNCNYCLQSDTMQNHLMISMGETIYLSIPPFEPVTEGHCFLIPIRHVLCATQLDENEWSELLSFRRSLCKMFNAIDKDVIFFETALYFYKHPHMVWHCVPVPREQGDLAPIYFKKAIDESETEWSINKKLVSLSGRDVRKAVPKVSLSGSKT
ncbi:Protein similar to CwfJ C-terminus 1 [Popillia japonica]|uniref:Protein similar to CwfJ C-terminus 1 n=1 Tax=Popillia japonica TaxID=7064 RepID=A0AAW1KIU6_POPJA